MDVVSEVEELLLSVGLDGQVPRQQTLRALTAARLPDPLHAEPEQNRHTQHYTLNFQGGITTL